MAEPQNAQPRSGLEQQWGDFFRKPEVVSGLLQFGASLLTPGMGGMGPALSQGAAAAGRAHQQGLAQEQQGVENQRAEQGEARADRQVDISSRRADIAEDSLGAQIANQEATQSYQRDALAQQALLAQQAAAQRAALARAGMEHETGMFDAQRAAGMESAVFDAMLRRQQEELEASLGKYNRTSDNATLTPNTIFNGLVESAQGRFMQPVPENMTPEDAADWEYSMRDPVGWAMKEMGQAAPVTETGPRPGVPTEPAPEPAPEATPETAAPPATSPRREGAMGDLGTGPAQTGNAIMPMEAITLQQWRGILADPQLTAMAEAEYGAEAVQHQRARLGGFMP